MNTPVRMAAFVAALAVAFVLAFAAGRLIGPIDTEPATPTHQMEGATDGH